MNKIKYLIGLVILVSLNACYTELALKDQVYEDPAFVNKSSSENE